MENPIDIDKTKEILEPDKITAGGLHISGKDRLVFRQPERKSLLGLDVLANAKRAGTHVDGSFKVPKEKISSMMASMDDEVENAMSTVTGPDEVDNGTSSSSARNSSSRRYRDSSGIKTFDSESQITEERGDGTYSRHGSKSNSHSKDVTPSSRSSRSNHHRSSRYDSTEHDRRRSGYRDESRSQSRESRRYASDRDNQGDDSRRSRESPRYEREYRDYGNKRSRYESSRRTPGRSDWDDGRWEWEDTPGRDGRSSSRPYQPSPSPMLVGASPDARLVYPWLGGNTPQSGHGASPWDSVAPSPVPIRASGSIRSSTSRSGGRSQQPFSAQNSLPLEDEEAEREKFINPEITESMRLEMEYNSDRAWYDNEEGNTMFDADSSSFYLGDDASVQKKEAELAKKLVRRDGTQMSLAQSKKLSQLTADNAQLEDRQLMRSGAVRGTEVQTEFDDEEERRVILLVHDTKPPFLDGRIVFTKQAEPIMPVKDPTSDMAIISRKGSNLVREVHEKQSMNKSRQRFWELAGSKLGNILGVEKSAEQIDADTTVVGEDGEVDFKEDAKFAQHLKKGEAVSDFAKSKSLAQQREYLPIFSVRDELLQVVRENQVIVVVGETGSGKTTQLTQYLHEAGYTSSGIVGCTQPRRVAAMSVAKRVNVTGPNTVIKYMTDGVLLRETLKDADLDKYRVVVMDEAHERSLSTDVLFGILKKKKKWLQGKFSNFFGSVPIFHIPGRTFPVQILYSKTPCEDYVEAAVKQAMTIHITSPPGDILIFMTGQDEIEATCYALSERMEQLISTTRAKVSNLLILPIYSQLPADLQAKIFEKPEDGARKCIVATNIAETSLTVDGIYYVIDTGYGKMKVYNPRMGMDALQVFPVSRAAAD
ncbi:putative RNA helicase [Helianthus anomalus]